MEQVNAAPAWGQGFSKKPFFLKSFAYLPQW